MSDEIIKSKFEESVNQWICDGYSADLRFFATAESGRWHIRGAMISLNPLPAKDNLSMRIENSDFVLGQIQINQAKKKDLVVLVEDALSGKILLSDRKIELPKESSFFFYSETNQRDRWFYDSHIQISGSSASNLSQIDLINIDNYLRSSSPPFDGLTDATHWLGLKVSESQLQIPSIEVRINPPADIIIDRSFLSKNVLSLILAAHSSFNVESINLAICSAPGNGLESRLQVAKSVDWTTTNEGYKQGSTNITLDNADNALVILMIESSTIRRQWFLDAEKARNSRLVAVQNFDKDLKMIRQAVLQNPDSNKFENGVAALLFLLGFTPAVQLESDSPDIIVSTPAGRLAIVECTTRVADFSTKLGKLVDRRGSLAKSLQSSGHQGNIVAVLVCRQPKDQISASYEETRSKNVILITKEELTKAFEQLRFHPDPEQLLRDAESLITSRTKDLFESER